MTKNSFPYLVALAVLTFANVFYVGCDSKEPGMTREERDRAGEIQTRLVEIEVEIDWMAQKLEASNWDPELLDSYSILRLTFGEKAKLFKRSSGR